MADEPTPDRPPRISVCVDMEGGTSVDGEPVTPGKLMEVIQRKQAELIARTKDQPPRAGYEKDPCCHNMRNFSATASERAKSGFYASVGIDPATLPDPLVNFSPVWGTYSIQSVALFYCPWCGAGLPRHANGGADQE